MCKLRTNQTFISCCTFFEENKPKPKQMWRNHWRKKLFQCLFVRKPKTIFIREKNLGVESIMWKEKFFFESVDFSDKEIVTCCSVFIKKPLSATFLLFFIFLFNLLFDVRKRYKFIQFELKSLQSIAHLPSFKIHRFPRRKKKYLNEQIKNFPWYKNEKKIKKIFDKIN